QQHQTAEDSTVPLLPSRVIPKGFETIYHLKSQLTEPDVKQERTTQVRGVFEEVLKLRHTFPHLPHVSLQLNSFHELDKSIYFISSDSTFGHQMGIENHPTVISLPTPKSESKCAVSSQKKRKNETV
ncbi:hypothetical protein Ocin01_05372, partial [Orchesella cincta]